MSDLPVSINSFLASQNHFQAGLFLPPCIYWHHFVPTTKYVLEGKLNLKIEKPVGLFCFVLFLLPSLFKQVYVWAVETAEYGPSFISLENGLSTAENVLFYSAKCDSHPLTSNTHCICALCSTPEMHPQTNHPWGQFNPAYSLVFFRVCNYKIAR